jgi:hypothetical protein
MPPDPLRMTPSWNKFNADISQISLATSAFLTHVVRKKKCCDPERKSISRFWVFTCFEGPWIRKFGFCNAVYLFLCMHITIYERVSTAWKAGQILFIRDYWVLGLVHRRWWTESKDTVIPSVIHHRQNPLGFTDVWYLKSFSIIGLWPVKMNIRFPKNRGPSNRTYKL